MTKSIPIDPSDLHVRRVDVMRLALRLRNAVPATSVWRRPEERLSILDLEGLGKEIWQGVDVRRYIDELRDEWDDR